MKNVVTLHYRQAEPVLQYLRLETQNQKVAVLNNLLMGGTHE